MNYKELITSAIAALRSNIFRTLLTMLGIIIGISSVILIISLGQGATQSIMGQLALFGTNTIFIAPGSSEGTAGPPQGQLESLTYEDAQAITDEGQIQNVQEASAIVSRPLQVNANGQTVNTTLQGVEPGYAVIQSLEVSQGEFLTKEDADSLSRVVVLGSKVATDLFGEGAEPVGESVKIDSRSFRIVGVLQQKDSSVFSDPNSAVYIPVTTAMKVVLGQNYVSSILVQAENADLINQTVDDITALLVQRHSIFEGKVKDFSIESSKQALQIVDTVTGLLTLLLAGIAGISLVVGGIGIMNIMLVTVTERTKEIGLLKAIGARDRDVLRQFLIEAVVLTLSGGVIGIVLGILLSFLISSVIHIPFVISFSAIFLAVGVSSAVGILFGYYPAQRAAKLSPIDALRYE